MSNENAGDKGTFGNLLSGKTPAVNNIEKAYSRAGATAHHTPGYASKLGSQDQSNGSDAGAKGVGSDHFKDNISDQRAEPSVVGKMFNNIMNGTENGK